MTLLDVPDPPVLRATAGAGQVLLEWDDPEDDSVTEWQYRGEQYHPAKGRWTGFRDWTAISGSTAGTTRYTVGSLTNGVRYRFFVRAENPAGLSEASNAAEAVLLTVAYSASSYEAWQGGAAVEVEVVLSPATDRAVSIPITVTADAGTEASDYTVEGLLSGGTVSFTPGESTQSFTITANVDEDRADETVSLGLGPLPSGVSAGTPASATVTLLDVPDQPTGLTATAGTGQAVLEWDDLEDDSVTEWQYRGGRYYPEKDVWTGFRDWTAISGSTAGTTRYTVTGLSNGVRYRFSVRAKNRAGEGPGSATAEAVLLTAAYSASSYQATEGGAAVSVGVVLSPATDRTVSIPIRVTAASGTEGGDYTVGGLSGGRLSFTSGESTRSFTITANVDGDGADETVSLGLGTLPSGVSAGTPASATVTLRDVVAEPDQPTGLTATAGTGQAVLGWDDLEDDSVTEWQYRGDRYYPEKDVWTGFRNWTAISGSSAGTTSYTVGSLTNGVRYRFSVRAKNRAGEGPGSATAEAVLLTAAYSASSYQATEGGAAVSVGVVLSPAADRAVSIPVRVTAASGTEGGAYTVGGLSGGRLSFTSGQSTRTFTIRANEDGDGADETVSLGLGTLPSGVSAGTPARATVTLRDVVAVPDPPRNLRATASNGRVTLRWQKPDHNGASITGYAYRSRRDGAAWLAWAGIPGSTANTTSHTVSDLSNDIGYTFQVRAHNRLGGGVVAQVEATPQVALLTVAYSASSYQATEGSAAVSVGVVLSPAADRAVSIPVRVTAASGTEGGDYTVGGLSGGRLSFTSGQSTRTFTIRANEDGDGADETVSLGLGTLPSGVSAGTPAGATVTLRDVVAVPAQPTGLRATSGNGQASLRWNALNDATVTQWQYRGERYQPAKGVWVGFRNWTAISGSSAGTTRYTVGSLSNGVRYRFSVRAKNRAGEGPGSATAEVTPNPPLPARPTGLRATSGNGRVTLRWNALNDATVTQWQYRGERYQGGWTGFRGWTAISGSSAGTTRYTVGSLSNGVRYRFSVRAKNRAGEGPGSATAEAVLLTVAYSASSYQATEGSAAVEVGVVLSPATDRTVSIPVRVTADSGTEGGDYTVGGLSGGRLSFTRGQSTRTFTITANVDEDGADETVSLGLGSLPSGVSAGTPARATVTLRDVVAVPAQPTGLRATAGNGQASLRWNVLNDATVTQWQYRGERYHPAKGVWVGFRNWTAISGSSAGTTRYTVGSLSNGVRYRFSVRAKNRAGEGPGSATAEVTPNPPLPAQPTGLTATAGNGQASLRWNALNDATVTQWQYRGDRYQPAKGVWVGFRGWTAISGSSAGTTSYTVGSLSNGVRYRFSVRAKNSAGEGPGSATAEVTPNPPLPDQPTGLRATSGNGQAALEWDDLDDDSVTEWQYRGDRYYPLKGVWVGFRGWTAISGSSAGTTSYTVGSLSNGVRYRFSVRAKNSAGEGPGSATAEVTPSSSSSFLTARAAPNPFNPHTTIQFHLPARGIVSLALYNLRGQVVRTIAQEHSLEAGRHTLVWDGRDAQGRSVASGMYLYRLTVGEQALVRKIILLK